MSIDNPIIDSGPTLSRAEAKTVIGRITDVVPPLPYRAISPLYPVGETRTQYPQREGELAFVESSDQRGVTPYVVISTGSIVADGGDFSTGLSLAEDDTPYDGGDFNDGTSSAHNDVDLDGMKATKLGWKRILTSADLFDPRTGQPKDPLRGFY